MFPLAVAALALGSLCFLATAILSG